MLVVHLYYKAVSADLVKTDCFGGRLINRTIFVIGFACYVAQIWWVWTEVPDAWSYFRSSALVAPSLLLWHVTHSNTLWREILAYKAFLPMILRYRAIAWWSRHIGLDADLAKDARDRIHLEYAPVIYQAMVDLGGFYGKLGQLFSSMPPGILPVSYEREFSKMPMEFEKRGMPVIRKELEACYGQSLESIFTTFEAEPIGVGSFCQVHRARIRNDNRDMVVKVQRPYAKQVLQSDFNMVQHLFGLLTQVDLPESRRLKAFLDRLRAHQTSIELLLDFEHEATTLELGLTALKKETFRNFRTPEVIREFSGANVLVMTEIYGDSLTQTLKPDWSKTKNSNDTVTCGPEGMYRTASGLRGLLGAQSVDSRDLVKLSSTLWAVVGHQIFVQGLFNFDMRPDNILIDVSSATCGLVDYGLAHTLSVDSRLRLARLIVALAENDNEEIAKRHVQLGMTSRCMSTALLAGTARTRFGTLSYSNTVQAGQWETQMTMLDTILTSRADERFDIIEHVISSLRCISYLCGVWKDKGKDHNPVTMWLKFAQTIIKESTVNSDWTGIEEEDATTDNVELNINDLEGEPPAWNFGRRNPVEIESLQASSPGDIGNKIIDTLDQSLEQINTLNKQFFGPLTPLSFGPLHGPTIYSQLKSS